MLLQQEMWARDVAKMSEGMFCMESKLTCCVSWVIGKVGDMQEGRDRKSVWQ